MVQVNGDLTTCCLDEHLLNKVGNTTVTPLAELWNGPTMQRWRQAHIDGRFEDSGPYCPKCNWRSAGALSPERVAAWRAARRA